MSAGMMLAATATALVVGGVGATPARADCETALPPAVAFATVRRDVETADLLGLRDVGEPDAALYGAPTPFGLSPDGQSIAFVVQRADPARNIYCRALMVLDLRRGARPRVVDAGGEPITITQEIRGSLVRGGFPAAITPGWSDDGRWIFFLKRLNGATQLWRARSDGGGAAPLTRSVVDVERWTRARGGQLLVASRPDTAAVERGYDREMADGVLYDGRIDPGDGIRPQLPAGLPEMVVAIDPVSGASRPATDAEREELAAAPIPGVPVPVDAVRGTRRATTEPASASPLAARRIVVVDADGTVHRCVAAPCADGIVQLWWETDRTVIFLRREGWAKGRMAIYRWTVGGAPPRRVLLSEHWLSGCRFDRRTLFCVGENATTPRRIVAIDVRAGRSRTALDLNPEFGALRLGAVRRVTWRNDRGLPAWGDLVLPPGYRRGRRVPLVVVQYHSQGFLRGGTGDEYPIFPLAARGMAVLSVERPPHVAAAMPELRTFDEVNGAGRRDWAERRSVFSSLQTGIDRVVAMGIADPRAIGLTGLSDGSTTLEWALIHSTRFAAAVTSTCCTDPRTVMTYGGIVWADWNRAVMGYPAATDPNGSEFWRPQSLAVNAARIDTPLLMQLADREYLLALEGFTALREQHKPVELVVFPDEYHAKWQPRHRAAIYARNVDWFAYWLQGARDPAPDKGAQYTRWDALKRLRDGAASTSP